jgi:autotransporter-associated beta strand protein
MRLSASFLGFVLLVLGLCPEGCPGQVVINELAAATSDRLLLRTPGAYPRVGHTTAWMAPGFDDSAWRTGNGPFGFGSFSGVTIATDVSGPLRNRGASLYLRQRFSATAAQATSTATLQLLTRYNDGFVAFLNGVEIARRHLGNPGMFIYHDQTAFNTNASQATLETINVGAASARLVPGENVLCIQVHNQALAGQAAADLLLQADLRLITGQVLASNASPWRYFPGLVEPSGGVLDHGRFYAFLDAGSQVAWASLSFNDSTWLVGPGPVGIEGASPQDYVLGVNLYSQAYNVTPSIYTRRVFSVSPAEAASDQPLRLRLDYDDGVIVYLNGRELVRRNVGSDGVPAPFDAVAAGTHNANGDNRGAVTGQEESVLLGPARELLRPGDNVLAVQLHNSGVTSSDAIARVTLETQGPGARILCQPTDAVSYFLGLREPVTEGEQEGWGPLDEPPDAENDWVELYNAGPTPVSLAGWSLTDNASVPRKWLFPTNATIPAGGFLLVLTTGFDTGPDEGATYLHTNFKLSSEGEYLGLVNAVGQKVSELSPAYPPQSFHQSYGRDTNGLWGYLVQATPGAFNLGQALGPAPEPPVFSQSGGFHSNAVLLTLSSPTPGAQIYFTLDGSDPDPGNRYANALALTVNRVVRARSVAPGCLPSATVTHTYLINQTPARRSLPALCLNGDPARIFYGPNTSGGPALGEGVLAIKGGTYINDLWTHAGDPTAFNVPLVRGRALEKPASLEFFPPGEPELNTGVGLRLAGSGWSRPRYRLNNAASALFSPMDETQKPSFNLYFRSEWGERPIEYPFFGGATVGRFSDLRLRAGKNDIANPFIKDELVRRLFIGTGQQGSWGNFVTLYINGTYKGYFNLCEHLREGFMQEHHQSMEAWDVQQVNEFASGDPVHWNQMLAYLRGTNLATLAGYQGVQEYLEVDNFIDYLVVNTFAAMWDWPANNWVAARERSPQGRWRFYIWDAEGSFGIYDRPLTHNSFTDDLTIGDARTTTWLYLPALYTLLRDSPEFRLRFADRVQRHFFNGGCLVKTNMQAAFYELRNAINPIMSDTIGVSLDPSFYNTWIVSDTRRNTYFTQLSAQGLWFSVLAPGFSHYGGTVAAGLQLALTNPNGSGTIYFTTNSTDPRAPGGGIAGQPYTTPLTIPETRQVKARVRSTAGVWSPVIEASFTVPPPVPTFLPAASGDWTVATNWSSAPAPYPDGAGAVAIVPPPSEGDRNVNLRAPVVVGQIHFPQESSSARNRVRDQATTNTLTFQATNGSALLSVGGTGEGYVEFEVLAGTQLASTLQLEVTNLVGNAEHGALRLRAGWSGPGGLAKTGPGVASLTGEGKDFAGPVVIEEGVLQVTQPATPTNASSVTVEAGGQLRLISANSGGQPRVHSFGGPISLAGYGRGAQIPDQAGLGKLGALRYDPGSDDNRAVVTNPILVAEPSDLHVDGSRNTLELTGPIAGSHAVSQSGGGVVRLTADSRGFSQPWQVNRGVLDLDGHLGGPVSIAAGAALTGHGSAGALSGGGQVRLGQNTLRAAAAAGMDFAFTFGKLGSPVYPLPTNAVNGVLVLGSAPVGIQSLDIYLTGNPPVPGSARRGGFLVPFANDLAGAIAGVPWRVFVRDVNGSHVFDGSNWSPLPAMQVTTVPETASLPDGTFAGRVLEVRYQGAPATYPAWQGAAFPNPNDLGNPLISGPGADPHNSGMPNLLRYALGLGLNDDPATRKPQFVGSVTAPGLRFPFDAGRNDLAYVVEVSTRLEDWSAATVLFDSRTDLPPPMEAGWITVADPAPSPGQGYYRLRVFLVSGG